MRVINHNWSATKQRLHPQCSRDKPPFSFVRGQDSTMGDIVWVSPQGHRSVSVSRHFLLQALRCPCSVRKRFSRDHCCRGRSKLLKTTDDIKHNSRSRDIDKVSQQKTFCSSKQTDDSITQEISEAELPLIRPVVFSSSNQTTRT